MDVEVDDLKHLAELVAGLRAPSLVVTAERLQG
jgi:hypothetical protein